MSAPVLNAIGTKTANDVYTRVCDVMLEPNGLELQLTPQQFLDMLAIVYLDFLQRAELAVAIHTQVANFAIAQYAVPEEITRPALVFYDGMLLQRNDQHGLDNGRGDWQGKIGEPQEWFDDGLDSKTIAIVEAPQFQGVDMDPTFGDLFAGNGDVTVIGPERPTSVTMTLGTPLTLIPDSFVPYLAYGVLHKFFTNDGETRDEMRATYSRARFDEGVLLASAMGGNDIEESDNE